MTGLTRPALTSHRNFRSRRGVGVLNVKNGGTRTVLQVEQDQKLKNEIRFLKYKNNEEGKSQLNLEIDHLMALLLNTFMWASWYGNLGLIRQEEVCLEITRVINQLVQDVTRRSHAVGDDWVAFVTKDVVSVVSDWIDGYDDVFALKDGNETLYSKVLIRHILAESLDADQSLLINFLVGLLDGVVFKSVVDGYSDNHAIWGIIDKVCDEILREAEPNAEPNAEATISHHRGGSSNWVHKYVNAQEPKVKFLYTDTLPMLRLVSQTTRLCEYPLLWCMITMVLRAALTIPILNNIVSNAIYIVVGNIINERVILQIVQILKRAMYPNIDCDTDKWCQWELKPRWCPETPEQLHELRQRCQTKVDKVYEKFSTSNFSWVIAGNGTQLVDFFEDKYRNKVLIWGLIDKLVNLLYKSRA